MKKFQITRTDINKVVVKPYEFADEESALGKYMSILMLAGIIKMTDAGSAVSDLGAGAYRLSNGWTLKVEAI